MNMQSRLIDLPAQTWKRIDAREPSMLRPSPNGTVQPTGQIYISPGSSPPPEDPSTQAAPSIPSAGFGTFTLAEPGPYQLYYAGTANTMFQMILEPLDGREPPPAEDPAGFFYRKSTPGGGTGITLVSGVAQNVFGTNARRKSLNLCVPDATGGVLYLRFDGTAPTVTNHDMILDLLYFKTIQLTGTDVPKGSIYALYVGTGSVLLTGSHWE